ncbi:MAG: glycosyltransferase [Lachnospiraceae bacterium]|nr:glycosyltransferase [Lachnospiraceae bacterium]
MPNVLLLKGDSQYSAMRNYIDEIEMGFRMAGYHTVVLDVAEESWKFQYTEILNSIRIDITFVCNAILTKPLGQAYYMTYLADHPAFHKERLKGLNDRSIVFVCDRRHKSYMERYCPNIKYVEYIPLSGEAVKRHIPYRERTRDIVFTGSYKKPEEAYHEIFTCDPACHEMLRYMADSIIENPQQDLEMCLQNCLDYFGLEVSRQEFDSYMEGFRVVDAYARIFYRDKMIRCLVESGLQVHVFGNGWEAFEGNGKENLIVEAGDYYIARKAVADSKISINIMPWFKDGFQERIAAAMLSGAVAVTDESRYIRENFTDGKEMVFYSLQKLEELPGKIEWLLKHPDCAEEIALTGKVRAQKEMTWQHRTFEMIRYMQECFSLPAPSKGKFGEILPISYNIFHERNMLLDAVAQFNEIIAMVSNVKLYSKMELEDIDYFYTKFLTLFVKINSNFPEVRYSEYIYQFLTNLAEGQADLGTELLLLECMHMLSVFLTMENEQLKKEKDILQFQLKQGDSRPNQFAQQMLIHKLKLKYQESEDKDIQEILRNIEKNQSVEAYNQDFADKYRYADKRLNEVWYDPEAEMHFTLWNGKKIYYPKGYTKEEVALAINFVYLEQDLDSPHRYLDDTFYVDEGDIVVDAGVAEGNFALEIIEKVKKIYLVECEHKWIEALQKTFEPWREKVVIVEKMLGDADNETCASLDQIVEEGYVNFLKLDVEGAEVSALEGASKILSDSRNVKCAICSYHRKNAERDIREILEAHHFYTSTTKGYMFFKEDMDSWIAGDLRHGIVRGVKQEWKRN